MREFLGKSMPYNKTEDDCLAYYDEPLLWIFEGYLIMIVDEDVYIAINITHDQEKIIRKNTLRDDTLLNIYRTSRVVFEVKTKKNKVEFVRALTAKMAESMQYFPSPTGKVHNPN